MWVDKGREFYDKDVQKLVDIYTTENKEKSCVIDRFNRTIKKQIFRYFSASNTRTFVGVLDLLVDQCNNANHSLIKMTPKEASRRKMKINCEEIYTQNLLLRPLHRNFRLLIMLV